ncbi:flagella biosynthesis regulatory protein FliZ [Bacillus carboniphilus]|uniref:Flagella biosynthesis regulatory protein FliZ n=1 Tax=Bacillus carboniphilus TaxID=86663 RepID=A0ABP3G0F8_9BACI
MKGTKGFILFLIFILVQSVLPFLSTSSVYAESVYANFCLENPHADECESGSQSTDTEEGVPSNVGITIFDVIKMIFSTVLVIGLLLFVLKWVQKKGRTFSNQGMIESLGGTSLGNQKSIQLVKVGKRIFVVGVGETISLIKEIEDEDEVQGLMSQQPSGGTELPIKSISNWVGGKKNPNQGSDFFQTLKGELAKVKTDRQKAISDWKEKKGSNQHE